MVVVDTNSLYLTAETLGTQEPVTIPLSNDNNTTDPDTGCEIYQLLGWVKPQ